MQHRAIKFSSAAFFITSLALASDIWILDASTSNARVFRGARANSELVRPGFARVTGNVKLDTNDLDASFFDLTIYPADEDWGHALSAEDTLSIGHVPDATDQTMLTFKSRRILRTQNGRLKVVGDLTLTHVDHDVTASPTEHYAGPVYGDPVVRNETREITFVFPSVSADHLSGPLTASTVQKRGVLEIVGSARVEREAFSKVLGAIKETSWPPVVQNKDYSTPCTVGEDYSVCSCTGTVVTASRDNNCDVPFSAGEDYSGPQGSPAMGNQTTIVLDLKFLHKVQEPSVEAHSGAESIGMPLRLIDGSN